MSWLILFGAGFFEMGFTFCLNKIRETSGTSMYLWIGAFLVSSFFSMYLLAKATQVIPVGTAYPVWTGIGAVGTVLLGIFLFHEPVSLWRLFFIFTLVVSVIGLKMV